MILKGAEEVVGVREEIGLPKVIGMAVCGDEEAHVDVRDVELREALEDCLAAGEIGRRRRVDDQIETVAALHECHRRDFR